MCPPLGWFLHFGEIFLKIAISLQFRSRFGQTMYQFVGKTQENKMYTNKVVFGIVNLKKKLAKVSSRHRQLSKNAIF